MDEIGIYHRELLAEAQGGADASGLITSEAFLEKISEILDEAGEVNSLLQSYYEGKFRGKSVQVDAFSWDPADEEGVLSVVICDFVIADEPQAIDRAEITRLLKRLVEFIVAAKTRDFRESLEETSDGFILSDLINRSWNQINKIKLIVVTNRVNKSRTDAQPVGSIASIPVTSNVWDLSRIYRFVSSGQTREDLVIDFAEDFGEPVPVLKASDENASLDSYIAVIPGVQLAAIYEKWGARLLEANVRSFLQARGKVNSGIRKTINEDPSMFFSYNNGLTATAETVEIADMGDGLLLMSANNFQIVNGGQTTASIHAARKLAPEQLKNVFVQMKLSVVPPELAEEVVPLISQFANSQNKVNAADFFANHPFHVKIEELSRQILAPSGDSGYRETKWFYERARGQFADERGRRSVSSRKQFDAEFPKTQFLTKTDLAKFENSFRCFPHIVSLGAQKNFAEFAKAIGREWKAAGSEFDEVWFKRLIAKAIIFRTIERLVPQQGWYLGGYRANIVTYAIAKVVHDAERRNRLLDLDKVWSMQRVPASLEKAFTVSAMAANEVITNPPPGIRNMGEWAKKQGCWAELAKRQLAYEQDFWDNLIDPESERARKITEKRESNLISGIAAQSDVVVQGADYWSQLLAFGISIGKLDVREQGILKSCTYLPDKIPTEKQSAAALAIAEKLEKFY